MTFHSAAWLIPTMVKIQELSQSYTSMTEEKWTTRRREWAVMAVNYVSSVTLIILTHIKKSPDRLHTSPTYMHVRKSQVCLHLTHWRDLQASFFCNCHLEWDQSTNQVRTSVIHIHLCLLLSQVSDCCSSFLDRELAAPADLRMCSVTSALCNTLMWGNTKQCWAERF